jgi:N-acyl-L-homoserine lactone synthetase
MDSQDITLIIRRKDTEEPIEFIHATHEKDLTEIFKIRARVYSKKGYFKEKKDLDIDEYDNDSKTVYFCAKHRGKVIGALRIIRKEILPTEKYFNFIEPKEISNIVQKERCEISRLVVERQEQSFIPRNLVMLFLLYRLINYAQKNKIKGGYAFIKESLYTKLQKIHFPFSLIKGYSQRYPDAGILYNYFNDPQDMVYPIYFFTDESSEYIRQLLKRKIFSHNTKQGTYYLENNLYTKFLKSLKII